jgi:hypothetical protein
MCKDRLFRPTSVVPDSAEALSFRAFVIIIIIIIIGGIVMCVTSFVLPFLNDAFRTTVVSHYETVG